MLKYFLVSKIQPKHETYKSWFIKFFYIRWIKRLKKTHKAHELFNRTGSPKDKLLDRPLFGEFFWEFSSYKTLTNCVFCFIQGKIKRIYKNHKQQQKENLVENGLPKILNTFSLFLLHKYYSRLFWIRCFLMQYFTFFFLKRGVTSKAIKFIVWVQL